MKKNESFNVILKKSNKKPFIAVVGTEKNPFTPLTMITYKGSGIIFEFGYGKNDKIKDKLELKIEILN